MKNIKEEYIALVKDNHNKLDDKNASEMAKKTVKFLEKHDVDPMEAVLWTLQAQSEVIEETREKEKNVIREAVDLTKQMASHDHTASSEVMAAAYENRISHERLLEILNDYADKPLRKTKKELPIREMVIKHLKNIK